MDVQEKHLSVASHTPRTGDLARNPVMCLDWELSRQTFGSQAGAQSPEPHQPGLEPCLFPHDVCWLSG